MPSTARITCQKELWLLEGNSSTHEQQRGSKTGRSWSRSLGASVEDNGPSCRGSGVVCWAGPAATTKARSQNSQNAGSEGGGPRAYQLSGQGYTSARSAKVNIAGSSCKEDMQGGGASRA